jgi:hypothetical protein
MSSPANSRWRTNLAAGRGQRSAGTYGTPAHSLPADYSLISTTMLIRVSAAWPICLNPSVAISSWGDLTCVPGRICLLGLLVIGKRRASQFAPEMVGHVARQPWI